MPLKISNLTVAYGENVIYDDFSAQFPADKISCIAGASGSGKTTLMNVVSGLLPFRGKAEGAGAVSCVFQEPRLIENISVNANLELVLRKVEKNGEVRRKTVGEFLRLAEMDGKGESLPSCLSGGERQRVALLRAFIYPSDTLIMDEPFRSLDLSVKKKLFDVFLKLYRARPRTVLFVTHDSWEAAALADEIYLLKGRPCSLERVAEISVRQEERKPYTDRWISLLKRLDEVL